MSLPIFNIIKPKNYEFNDKYRKVQLNPANTHPLRGAAGIIKVKDADQGKVDDSEDGPEIYDISSTKDFTDSSFDPLSSGKGKSDSSSPSKKGEERKGEEEEEDKDDKDEKLDLEELKTAANTNVWKDEIRGGLLKIFNPKKLEHLKIRNPFKAEKMSHERVVVYTKVGKDNNQITQESSQDKPVTGLRTYVTYSYYIKSIEAIKRDILKAWKREDKVLALQLAIQGVKLLMDTEEPNFYPAKYTFVIDLLEVFSMLVFERIKKLSFPKLTDDKLKEIRESNIDEANINEAAKDICRNWFLKISVIRELMPRIYIQCALTRNLVFLNKEKIKPTLMRLLMTCRGLTDPLIASYCQIYILRIAIELLPKEKMFMKIAFNDFLLNMREGGRFQHKSLSFDEYMTLFEPYLEVIFKFYSQNSSEEDFKEMLKTYENSSQHAEILKKFIKYFSPQRISDNMLQINGFIECHNIKNRLELYSLLCDVMNKCLPSPNVISVLFQRFIKDVYEIKEFVPFLNFTAVLLDLISKNYDSTTRNQFLISILKRFADFFTTIDWTNEGKDKEVFEKLQEFLEKIISTCENISEIMALEPFFQFVTYLPSTMKKSICKKFLATFGESNQKIDDPILVHTLLSIAKNLNDDYGFSMTEAEKQEAALLVRKMVKNVNFGKDIEQMLNFYTEVRAYFGNLPGILELLVDEGLDVAMKCRKFSKGRITKQIFSFIQASISFCLISISSIEDKITQFDYFVRTAQVALLFNLTSQAETLCKSAIGLFAELPKKVKDLPIEDVIESKIKNLISFLIVLPENPENDYLHIFNGLYAGLTSHVKWSKRRGLFIRTRILCDCFVYLCVQLQDKLPYHIENIKSNDSLYTEEDYKQTIFVKFQEVSEEIIKNIAEINSFEVPEVEPAIAITKINLNIVNIFLNYIMNCPMLLNSVNTCVEVIKKNIKFLRSNALKGTKFVNMIGNIRETLRNIKKNLKDAATTKMIDDLALDLGINLS